MHRRLKYVKRSDQVVVAVQLALETTGFTYRKWGGVQTCKAGDWIVNNGERLAGGFPSALELAHIEHSTRARFPNTSECREQLRHFLQSLGEGTGAKFYPIR